MLLHKYQYKENRRVNSNTAIRIHSIDVRFLRKYGPSPEILNFASDFGICASENTVELTSSCLPVVLKVKVDLA